MADKHQKDDRRVKYTKLALRQSLLELLEEKPIGRITVKEICERADINRATFYAHYFDAFDLLEKIESSLIESIEARLDLSSNGDISASVKSICHTIKENQDICTILFGDFGDRGFIERILNIIREQIVASWTALEYRMSEGEAAYAYAFATNGSIGILRVWQAENFSTDPDDIAELILRLIFLGLQSYAKDADIFKNELSDPIF